MKFHEVLDTVERAGRGWTAVIPPGWMQGRAIYGGVQVALAVRAMRGVIGPALPLRSLHATFVAPLHTGQVRLRTDMLRTGRSVSHVHCGLLLDDGAVACTVVAIYGAARPSSFAREIPRPRVAVGPEALVDMPYRPGQSPTFLQHMQVRWVGNAYPGTGQAEPRTLVYARLRESGCSAEEALAGLADIIPTPALSTLHKPAPASSLNWMLEFVRDPREFEVTGWTLIDTDARAGRDGYVSQTSVLWGPCGHAYTVSHQTVAIFG
jgi:acyl-CoA thioesterase